MSIAIVDEWLPFPPDTGKRIRSFGLISRLARDHEITYFAHRQNAQADEVASSKLQELGIQPVLVDHYVPSDEGWRFGIRLGRNLLSSVPYSVQRHVSSSLQQAVRDNLYDFDVWHCEWVPYMEYFRKLKPNSLVVDAHNIESQIWQRYYDSESKAYRKWYIKKQLHKFRRFETWAFSRRSCRVRQPW